MSRRAGLILIFLLASAAARTLPVFGQETTNAFLEIGVGPRAIGMGGAFCGIADDGTAFYWNPAGLSLVGRPRLSAMYGPQFGTIANPLGDYHFLGLALPMKGDVRIGVNWIRLSVDDIPVYPGLEGESYLDRLRDRSLQPDGRPEGYLQDTEDAFFFSFSKLNANRLDLGWLYHRVRIDIPVGINIKWIRQSVGSYSATGLGVDVGTMMRFHLNDLFQSDKLGWFSIGLHLQDATRTTMRWNTRHQDETPRNWKFGMAYRCPLPVRDTALLLAYDHDSRWGGMDRTGLEFQGFSHAALRIGSDDGRLTAGAGLKIGFLEADYAFVSHSLNSLHRVGCSISF
ncbi:MAG: hypothetical protein QUS35_00770 [bacterium]|nr:hypothetical protein [bacterium]